jgi:hypothetical protein
MSAETDLRVRLEQAQQESQQLSMKLTAEQQLRSAAENEKAKLRRDLDSLKAANEKVLFENSQVVKKLKENRDR